MDGERSSPQLEPELQLKLTAALGQTLTKNHDYVTAAAYCARAYIDAQENARENNDTRPLTTATLLGHALKKTPMRHMPVEAITQSEIFEQYFVYFMPEYFKEEAQKFLGGVPRMAHAGV